MPTVTPVEYDPFYDRASQLSGPAPTGPDISTLNSVSPPASSMSGMTHDAPGSQFPAYLSPREYQIGMMGLLPVNMLLGAASTAKDLFSGKMARDAYADSPFGTGRPLDDVDTGPTQTAAHAVNTVGLMSPGALSAPENSLGALGGNLSSKAEGAGWNPDVVNYLANSKKAALASGDKYGVAPHIDKLMELGPGDAATDHIETIADDGQFLAANKIHEKATDLQGGDAMPEPDIEAKIEALHKPYINVGGIKEIPDWSTYDPGNNPNRGTLDPALAAKATPLGFNPNIQLYKGMSWHTQPGEGVGTGFADPALKPHERGIFTTARPDIADLYAGDEGYESEHGADFPGGGYQMVPMLARANKAFSVDWPAYNGGHGAYEGTAMEALLDHIRGQGGDMAAIHGVEDWGGKDTQYVPLNNNQLRVRHAAFNSADIDSPDLMKATGLPIMTPVDHDPFKDANRGR